MVVCDRARVWRLDTAGGTQTLFTVNGSANDLALTPDGGMYVTVPVWDGVGMVYYCSPQGQATVVLDSAAFFPNGIEYESAQNRVYIAYTQSGDIRRYDIGQDGPLSDAGLHAAASAPDGMAFDTAGNLWVADAAYGKVNVYGPSGDTLGFIDNAAFGSSVQNCCFAGPENTYLYIAAATGIFRVRTQTKGRDTRGGIAAIRIGDVQPSVRSESMRLATSTSTCRLDGRVVGQAGGRKAVFASKRSNRAWAVTVP
jgi:sugar lactone lactonase YvrE